MQGHVIVIFDAHRSLELSVDAPVDADMCRGDADAGSGVHGIDQIRGKLAKIGVEGRDGRARHGERRMRISHDLSYCHACAFPCGSRFQHYP